MRIAVIGAGNSGLAMAGHLSLFGHEVRLWNRSEPTIEVIRQTGLAHLMGELEGVTKLALVTTDLAEAVRGCSLILITTPASSHRELAVRLAPILEDSVDVVLNPGRTFGAIEFRSTIQSIRADLSIHIAETQTIIYTCRKIGPATVNILAFKQDVLFSSFNPDLTAAMLKRLPDCLRGYFIPARSMIETSLGNVGMILHCLPFLINISRVESGQPFKYYIEGITPSVAKLLEKADAERLAVAARLGQTLESCEAWMKRTYQIRGEGLYEVIQANTAYYTIDAPANMIHRYIFEDIPCGLVPLEVAGRFLEMPTPVVSMILDFATHLLDHDFRQDGRNLSELSEMPHASELFESTFLTKEAFHETES